MKTLKIISLILFTLLSVCAIAQPSKGTFLVGGNFSATFGKNEYSFPGADYESKSNTFSFSPRAGYFVADNFLLGLSLPLYFTKSETTSGGLGGGQTTNESSSNSVGIGPFLRYYIPVNEKFFVLTEAGYFLAWQHYESKVPYPSEGDDKIKQIKIGAGLAYFVNKNVAVEMLAAYSNRSGDEENSVVSGLSIEIGFQIYLSKE
jgi:hypothetical protein